MTSAMDDLFADITGPVIEDEFGDMTLEEIQMEINAMQDKAERGEYIDEKRFDFLLEAQENHPEFRALMEEERENWIESVSEFVENCLERTRSFVPVNVFDSTFDDLVSLGLSQELSKRILQRQCLWLVRMSRDEISRLHESDLLGRFNSLQQNLDIIETAAIYAALPDEFLNDTRQNKVGWKKSVEDNLRQMLMDNDSDDLPDFKIRNPAYEGRQYGPVKDVTSTREVEVTKGDGIFTAKKSFLDLCPSNSVMNRMTRSMRKNSDRSERDFSARSFNHNGASSFRDPNGSFRDPTSRNASNFNMHITTVAEPSDGTGSPSPQTSPLAAPLLPRLNSKLNVLTRDNSAMAMGLTSPSNSFSHTSPQKNVSWRQVNADGTPSTVVEIDDCGDFEED